MYNFPQAAVYLKWLNVQPFVRTFISAIHHSFHSVSRFAVLRARLSRVLFVYSFFLSLSLMFLVWFFLSISSYDYNNALRRDAAGDITRSSSYRVFIVALANDGREMETGGLSTGGQRLKRGLRGDGIAS